MGYHWKEVVVADFATPSANDNMHFNELSGTRNNSNVLAKT